MRFRILHTLHPGYYPALVDRILSRLPADVSRVTVSLPEHAGDVDEALGAAGFGVCGRAYVLRHHDPRNASRLDYPSGTQTRPATPALSTDWANIVNSAMHRRPGHVDMTYALAGEALSSPRVLGGASLIAYRDGSPAGVVLTVTDAMDSCAARITMLAVVPSHQGIGLGRALLHDAVVTAGRGGCRSVSSAVDAYDRRAVALCLDAASARRTWWSAGSAPSRRDVCLGLVLRVAVRSAESIPVPMLAQSRYACTCDRTVQEDGYAERPGDHAA